MQPQVIAPRLPGRARRVPARGLAHIAVIVVLAVLAGAAIMLQIRGWAALERESGRVCGTGGSPCPGREVPALVVSFALGLVTLPLLIWVVVRRTRVYSPAVAAAGLAVGVLAAQALSGSLYGGDLRVDWTAPRGGAGAQAAEGVWATPGSLVRVSAGQIVSYQAATGHPQWTLAVPAGKLACAISAAPAPVPRMPGHLAGLIGFGAAGGACDHILAVDLVTGRPLWSGPVGARWKGDQGTGLVAASAGTAVALNAGGVLNYSLRTGALRWALRTPQGCSDQTLAAGPRSAVVLAACSGGFDVIAVDLASGRQVSRTPVAEPAPGYQFAILSTDPVVVDDRPSGGRPGHLLVFGANGRLQSMIPDSDLDTSYYQGSGPQVAISGGLLAGVTRPSGGHSDVVAFRLADGSQQWRVQLPGDVANIRQDGGQLLALEQSGPDFTLDAITIAGGSLRVIGHLPGSVAGPGGTSVYPAGGRYLMAGLGGGSAPPAAAIGG